MNITELLNRMTTGRALIIGFLFAGVYYFIFFDKGYAQQQQIEAMKIQRQELETKLKEAETKIARATVYKRSATELGGTMEKLLSVIPEKFDIQDLMKIVSNEQKASGSSLVNIVPRPPLAAGQGERKEFEEFELDVELTGSFAQHMVFLANLTKVNQILTIRKLNLEALGTPVPNEPPNLRMNANVVAYRYVKSVPPPPQEPQVTQ